MFNSIGRSFGGVVVLLLMLGGLEARAISFEPDAPGVNGFRTVDKISWIDSKGLTRELYFAKDFPNAVVPGIKGYVTRLTWQPSSSAARIIAEENPSAINASNAQGWGTNVMHMHWMQYGGTHPVFGSGFSATTSKRDGFDFWQGPVLRGPHHLVFRVTYKQYTTLLKQGVPRKWVWVTNDWFIADGLDHVIYAITLDSGGGVRSDSIAFLNNTLAPYSLVTAATWKDTWDWAGGDGPPDGQSFGDFKVFVTSDMRNWTYGGTNTIPFIWQWVTPASGRGDAEAAYVQTETYAQKHAGEGFAFGNDAHGSHLPVYPDLNGEEYAYQMNFFDGYGSKRLTWGSEQGAFYGGSGSTVGFIDYSVAVHLGRHSDHGASDLLRETEAIHDGRVVVQALVGALVASGPEGNGNATVRAYSPLGFNHVYRTWEARAASNSVRLRFDTAVPLERPVLVVRGFTGTQASVTVNGVPVNAEVSLDDAADVLWVTMPGALSGSTTVEIVGTTPGCVPSCAPGTCGVDGCGGTCACAAGAVCLTNLTCCVPNTNTCGPDGCGGSHGVCPCTPSCAAGTCGADGCGGTCACAPGAVCLATSTCCQPTCAANACGSDGCGGTCSCAPGAVCLATSLCCQPSCAANTCGADGCGGTCSCAPDAVCLPGGACCLPTCASGSCGSDGCGGTCRCQTGTVCLPNQTCCTPNTNPCGPDGCGGTHGECPSCNWDPGLGTASATTTNVEFTARDSSVATLSLEVTGTPNRTIALVARRNLSGGSVRFNATASPAIASGTRVRLLATQTASAGGRTASSAWFAYLQAGPALDCSPCVPFCAPGRCGGNQCGGSCGCATGAICMADATCCQPNSNTCGSDGCGGWRGECSGATCTRGDGDGDGICDDRDNCTSCWNAQQSDADHDRLGDCWRCDWCNGAGTDTDWDGFCDGVDNCPTSWNQSQLDSDGDGLGNACDPT